MIVIVNKKKHSSKCQKILFIKAKPLNKQPSNAHGDLEEHGGLLCLMISMQSFVVSPSRLSSQFSGFLILLKLKEGSLGSFLFTPKAGSKL